MTLIGRVTSSDIMMLTFKEKKKFNKIFMYLVTLFDHRVYIYTHIYSHIYTYI